MFDVLDGVGEGIHHASATKADVSLQLLFVVAGVVLEEGILKHEPPAKEGMRDDMVR